MDAFVVRTKRKLFANDKFLILDVVDDTGYLIDKSAAEELRALISANGGVVLPIAEDDPSNDQKETKETGVMVILLPSATSGGGEEGLHPMLSLARRRFPHAVVLSSQWITASVAQKQRLAYHSFQVPLARNKSHARTATETQEDEEEEQTTKKQKLEITLFGTKCERDNTVEAANGACLAPPYLRTWQDLNDESLLILDARPETVKRYTQHDKVKIAAFDLDGTVIVTKSGKRFAQDSVDWKWFHPTQTPARLKELAMTGYEIVFFSNQNGIAKGNITALEVQKKIEAIIHKLKVPMIVYLATKNDLMRKPRIGAWHHMLKTLDLVDEDQIDKQASFYCGDAAGRPKVTGRTKDFAATDYKFALNIDISFHTPEKMFLHSKQRIHTHPDMWEIGFDPRSIPVAKPSAAPLLNPSSAELSKTSQEIVLLVGPPASGKSWFAKTYFSSYAVVSQDELHTVTNCKKKCADAIARNVSVIIDSTNRDTKTRQEWVTMAKQRNLPIRCFEMDVPKPLAMHLNTFRSLTEDKKIPDIAIHTFYKTFVPPKPLQSVMSSKIKDGLFMGDSDAAQDADFLQLNGIVHIINCVPRQLPNLFQQTLGLSYTTCDLDEVLQRPFFDLKNREFLNIVQLIDKGLEKTESVLVHSLNGINRSPSVLIGYLMVKYCWGVDKAYDFMVTKRADVKIHESYIEQLCALEAQLQKTYPGRTTEQQVYEWNTSTVDPKTDEIVLVHTFLNSFAKSNEDMASDQWKKSHSRKVHWIDQSTQMKKLFPSLLVKPERPPNNSYSEMLPANGWIDILCPTTHPSAIDQRKLLDTRDDLFGPARLAFLDSDRQNVAPTQREITTEHESNLSSSDAEDPHIMRSGPWLHSFSVPRKKGSELEHQISLSPSSSNDQEEIELTAAKVSSKQSQPRYLQQTRSSSNARPRKAATRRSVYQNSSVSTSRTALPSNANMNAIFTRLNSDQDIKSQKATTKTSVKKPLSSSSSFKANLTSNGATRNILFSTCFPPAADQRSSNAVGGISRRSLNEPLQQPLSASVRPRTAPPRIRKKEIETSDLLCSKKMDPFASSRMGSDPPPTSARGTRASFDQCTTTSTAQSAGFSVRRSTVSCTTSFSRAKTARAHWR